MFLNSQLEEALTVNVNLMSQIESNNQSTIGRSQKMRTPSQMARDEELEDSKYNLLQSQQQEEKMKKKIEKITVEKQMLEAQVHTSNEDLCDTQLGLTEQDDSKQHLRRTARENQKLMDAVSRYGKGTPGKSNQIDLQRMWGQSSAAVRQNEKSEKFGEMERRILENSKKTIEGMYEEVQSGKDMEQCVAGKILSVLKNGKSSENSGEEEGEAVSVSTLYSSLAVLSMTITGETENKLKDIISVDSEHERDMEELRLRMKTEETVRRKFEEKYVELKHKAEVEISNADRARQEALDSLVLVREEIAQQASFYEKEIETVKSASQEKSMKSHEDASAALRAEMEIAVREAQESGKSQVEESKLQVEREQRERLDQLQTESLRVCEERDRSVKKIESLQRDVDNVRKSMESSENFVEEKRGESAKRVVDRLNDDERRLHELNEKSASLAIALQRIQNDSEQRKREEGEKEEEKKRREEEAEETKRQTEETWSQEQKLRSEDSERSAEQIRKMEEKNGELEREREAINRELEHVREEREKSVAREREEVKMKEESQEREKELSRKFQEMVEENRRSEEQKQNERAGTGQEMEKLREELEAEKRKFEENSKQQEDKLTEMHRQMEDMRKTIENSNQQKVVDQEAIRKFEENEKESEEEKKKMKKEMEEENERRKREEEERKKEEDLQRERRSSIPGHALLFAPGKLDENSMKTQEVDEAQRRVVDVFNELSSSHNAFRGRQPLGYTYYDVATSLFDGTLLCSSINVAAPGTIDGRVVVWTPEDWSSVMDNHNLCVNSAIGIGVQHSKNISSKMLADAAVPHILQFVAEVEEIYFLSKVSYSVHPVELYQLMKNIGQKPSTVRDMSPEDILMRWVNFHSRRSDPSAKEVNSFSNDFKDGSVSIRVSSQISPEHCGDSLNTITTPSDDPQELFKRAEKILSITSLMGCSKPISGARDIVQGTGHLITVLLADVYHHFPTVPPVTPTSTSAPSTPRQPFVPSSSSLDLTANMKEEEDGNREERAFRLWMNSVGFTIRNMSEDLRDGLVSSKVMDSIVPNKVNWNKVNVKVPLNAYQKIENCNYVVSMAQSFKFSVTNIGGKDLYEGNRKLTLGIVWQIIRLHMFTILNDSRTSMSASSKEFSENDIIQWANGQMTDHDKPSRITGFKDTTLRNGKFLLDLIDCIRPGRVNYDLVMQGEESEDFKLNAQYAISLARGSGCCVFLSWEDITESNPKMSLTFVGTLMSMWAKSSLPPDRAH